MYPITEIDNVTLAYPASVKHLMPKMEDIPEEFKQGYNSKWNKIASDWFFFGLKNPKFYPKEGVDAQKAYRQLYAIIHSFEPKHEHKEAALAFLMSEWFEDITYELARPSV